MTARTLHDHQAKAIQMLRTSLGQGKRRPILQASTGFGKTVVAGAIINSALAKGKRVAFVVPAISLVDQTVSSFWDDGIRDVGVIQADHYRTDWSRPVQVCSIQTVQARGYPEADLVLVDECHKVFKCQVDWMADPAWQKVPFIGLSATPWSVGLGKIYDDLLIASTTQDLIEKGFLSKFRVFAPSHPDLTGVRTQGGDFVEADLSKALNKTHIVADVVETWMRLGEGRPTLVFAVDRAHAKSLQQRYEEVGIPCGYVDAFTTPDERKTVARKFASGEYPVVTSVGCLTTGVDWDVRCIVLARPTKSEILFTQIIGRGLRTAAGKDDCLILDHSDTHTRLGFVTDIKHETLSTGERPTSQARSSEAMPKECSQCSYLRPPKVTTCPSCGFKPKPVSQVQTFQGDLNEVVRGKGTKATGPLNTVRMGGKWIPLGEFYGQLRQRATDRGYSDGWASNNYREAVGTWPNNYKFAPMMPVCPEVNSWLKSRAIAYAHRRDKAKGGADARAGV